MSEFISIVRAFEFPRCRLFDAINYRFVIELEFFDMLIYMAQSLFTDDFEYVRFNPKRKSIDLFYSIGFEFIEDLRDENNH
jgi:hypothetical protein